jgi:predicted lipoprotein with Yx(FWY)xxD motif
MIRNAITGAVATAVALIALTLSACGGSGGATGATGTPPPAKGGGAVVNTTNSSLGTILDDSRGFTVYLFKKDSPSKSACTGACASAWPPLRATGKPLASPALNASLVSTVPRADGKAQVAYNGHPLYTYSGDSAAGDANGQGVTAFGAGWFAVSPAGDQIAGVASTSSGAGGY